MANPDQRLLPEAQHFIRNLFAARTPKAIVYHNYDHTWDVVQACETMVDHYQLSEDDREVLLLAAWFHDAGYLTVGPKDHEEESQRIATAFLQKHQVDPDRIRAVNECILATKMPAAPQNLLQQILCDADLYHLGTDGFSERNKKLREEMGNYQKEPVSKRDWRQINIDFLERHRYFTDYAREKLEPVKQAHLQEIREKQGRKERAQTEAEIPIPMQALDPIMNPENSPSDNQAQDNGEEKEKEVDKAKNEKDKQSKSDRGVVAMFRIMSENHVNLSSMADSKANIMISINTIVISILVSVLLGKLQFYPQYIIPTILLMLVCLGAIVFSILATRPNISGGTFSEEDIRNKKINLLFFGNFFNMQLPEYDWAMKEMMKDRDYLYGSMIKDIYFLGVVLARKYKLLRISYNIFMFGLIASILAFGIAMLLTPTN